MKVVILAGGLGSRLSELTKEVPKPMVEIGGIPILLHLMSIYAAQGHQEFVIAVGYKGHYVKEYFRNYFQNIADCTVNLSTGSTSFHGPKTPAWTVTVVDTGQKTMTGGRIKRLQGLPDGAIFKT